MYKLSNTPVSIEAEINAMVEYLATRWENLPDLATMFAAIQKQVSHDARYWVDVYPLASAFHERAKRRTRFLEESTVDEDEKRYMPTYDQCTSVLRDMSTFAHRLGDIGKDIDGKWDYSARVRHLYQKILPQFPELNRSRPRGWENLEKGYQEQAGIYEYSGSQQRVDEDAFKGADASGSGADAFPTRTALPFVMYDDRCQGRTASYVLVSAAYGHFIAIQEHVNTRRMLEEFESLPLRDTEPGPLFDFSLESQNPLMAALLEICRDAERPATREDYEKALESARAFQKLPQEERDAIRTANRQRISQSLGQMFRSTVTDVATPDLKDEAGRRVLLGFDAT
jgi:hypothetical protein